MRHAAKGYGVIRCNSIRAASRLAESGRSLCRLFLMVGETSGPTPGPDGGWATFREGIFTWYTRGSASR